MKKFKFMVSIFVLAITFGLYPSQSTLATESETVQESINKVTESTSESSATESDSETLKSSAKESKQTLPKIVGAKDKTIKLNQKFNPKEGITAVDAKDGVLTNKLQISGNIDTSKAGKYDLTYSVVNSQGEKAVQKVIIEVQAQETPKYRMEIADFSIPLKSNFSSEIQKRVVIKDKDNKVVDNKGIKVSVEENAQYNKSGVWPVKFLVEMLDGTTLNGKVNITAYGGIYVVEPNEGYTYTGSIYEDAIDLLRYIKAYEIDKQGKEKYLEAYDKTTGVGIKIIKNDLDVSSPGKYSIVYKLTNSLGDTLEHTSYVTVVKKQVPAAPTIQVEDQLLYVGDVLTKEIVLGWAKTTNADQLAFEVLDDQIVLNRLNNRIEKEGVYKIRYTASRIDEATQAELNVQKDITLTVREKKTTTQDSSIVTDNTGTTLKKTIPTTSASTSKSAKSLPKTGSEKANLTLIFVGAILVGVVIVFGVKKNVWLNKTIILFNQTNFD